MPQKPKKPRAAPKPLSSSEKLKQPPEAKSKRLPPPVDKIKQPRPAKPKKPPPIKSCFMCNFATDQKKEMSEHKRRDHGFRERHYPCNQCEYVGATGASIVYHVNHTHKLIKLRCDVCELDFANRPGLARHMREVHQDASFRIKPKKNYNKMAHCDQCVFAAASIGQLREHIAVQHEGKLYRCDQCTFETKWTLSLKGHIESMHQNIKHKCEECDAVFSEVSNLRAHRIAFERKNDRQKYSCDVCGFVACLLPTLRKHRVQEHAKVSDQMPCDECDKRFYTRRHLRRHKRAVHEHERFPCDICNQEFVYRKSMVDHKRKKHNVVDANGPFKIKLPTYDEDIN